MTRKAVKSSVITDHLVENTIDNYMFLSFGFLNEVVMALLENSDDKEPNDKRKMYFNGVVNLSENGIKAMIISPKGK